MLSKIMNQYWKMLIILFIGVMGFAGFAMADDPVSFDLVRPLCKGIDLVTGTIGKPIAVIILIMLAILMLMGKATVGLFIATAVGMTIMFSAVQLVYFLTKSDTATNDICVDTSNKP